MCRNKTQTIKLKMTYIVKDECIKCKLTDCVEVCPVDCFYEGENMLVINPDECIDCGVCEPECPIDAIKADTDDSVEYDNDNNPNIIYILGQLTTSSTERAC